MNVEQNTTKLKSFNFGGKEQAVSYVETMRVADGVDYEVYTFDGDLSKDLGIITSRTYSGCHLESFDCGVAPCIHIRV